MKIKDILNFFDIDSNDENEIINICLDSKKCSKGSLFIALKGTKNDGSKFIPEALKNGASLVFSETKANGAYNISNIKERLTSFSMWFYGYPNKKLSLIGITGTEGKSTTAYIISQVLNSLKSKNSLLITCTEGIENSICVKNTTPYGNELAEIFNYAVNNGYKYVVMECSSIGISEDKLKGINFDLVSLTNLKEDHLDYHKTKKIYHDTKINFIIKQAKKLVLFDNIKQLKKIANQFDENNLTIIDSSKIEINNCQSTLSFLYDGLYFDTKFIFKFNALNIVLAYEALKSLNIKEFEIIKAIKEIKPLLGRGEVINTDPLVIIDYAHTASSFENIVKEVYTISNDKKIIVVFGAGGEREKSKRAIYGKIALKYCYLPIITSDNNRNEDFSCIANDIVKKHKDKFLIIKDRKLAIKWATSILSGNHILLLVGKGPEKTMIENGISEYIDERKEVKKWLPK